MRCIICNGPMEQELLLYTVTRDGRELSIEDVPTWVCTQCDNVEVDDEVGEAVEEMLDAVLSDFEAFEEE